MQETIEKLRWQRFPVLDHGFVCLADVMGSDQAVVQAARVSYGDGTKQLSDDRALLRYLMRHQHTTPFEMAEIKLLVRVPMDIWRQWIRHRTASVNEYSTRYSVAISETAATKPDAWRLQTQTNRQGSAGTFELEIGTQFSDDESAFHRSARDLYNKRVELGMAREQARKDLPLSTYTEAYWKIDLHNLFRFLFLRMAPKAQTEIVQYATTIGEKIVKPLFPLAWEAFLDYQLHSVRLSRLEQAVIARLAENKRIPATLDDFMEHQEPDWKGSERCRERDECLAKLQQLRIVGI